MNKRVNRMTGQALHVRLAIFGAIALFCAVSGCLVAGSAGSAGTQVLYLVTNRSGSDVTFNLDLGGETREGISVAADGSGLYLDDCSPIDDFSMTAVCTSEGENCNNLGIIISPSEVSCGNVVDVFIDPPEDGQLILSAFLRSADGTPGGQQEDHTDSTTPDPSAAG